MNLRLRNFLPRKNPTSSFSRRQKLAGSKRTTIAPSNFSSRICGFRTTSSARHTTTVCANCSFLEAPAFIQSSRRNRSRKARCSLARWSRRTKRTRSPRSPASSFARHFLANTGSNFISAMPTNLYGPNDNFDLETSHVLAALLRKAHEAKMRKAHELVVWGSGKPRREFLHVDDLASACLFLLEKYDSPEIINVGCGEDIAIRELAELICDVVGFDGELTLDTTKPDGTPRRSEERRVGKERRARRQVET